MEKIKVGLIRGRHEMPVSEYIFDSISNIHDYKAIRRRIVDFLENQVGLETTTGVAVNQADYSDIKIWSGRKHLIVYVTGLTPVTAELVAACCRNGVRLTLMNFDTISGNYLPEPIL